MKLIEAMKRVKIIEKQMNSNGGRISEYAAIVSNERPALGTEDAQRKEIRNLIQENTDLMTEYLRLKRAITKTNLETKVTIQTVEYCLEDFLVLRRGGTVMMKKTYQALNDKNAQSRLTNMRGSSLDKTPRVEPMYDEKEKHAGIQKWQDLEDEIEMRLETINATTELV